MVEQSAVNRSVVGSNPTCGANHGGVAQLARAFGSYPKGRGFDSLCRYQISIFRTLSSVGQSGRLITDWSQVRILQGPPFHIRRNTQVWLKGSVLKTERGVKARGGSNPSSSSIHIIFFILWNKNHEIRITAR